MRISKTYLRVMEGIIWIVVFCTSVSGQAFTQYDIVGAPGMGANRGPRGQPTYSFPHLEQFIESDGLHPLQSVLWGVNTSGAYDAATEGEGNSPDITPASDDSTIMATHYDSLAMSLPFFGIEKSMISDERLNVPIHDNFLLTDFYGIEKERRPCIVDDELIPFPRRPGSRDITNTSTRAASVEDQTGVGDVTQRDGDGTLLQEERDVMYAYRASPCMDQGITLGKWMEAGAALSFRCYHNGAPGQTKAQSIIRFFGLLPNKIYTVWLMFDGFPAGAGASPFGGVPNVIASDINGEYTMKRKFFFCPPEEERYFVVLVHCRTDYQNYGGVPAPFYNQMPDSKQIFQGFSSMAPGITFSDVLTFLLRGEIYDEEAHNQAAERMETRLGFMMNQRHEEWQF